MSRIAVAQTYPTRPITMVVAFGPGGPSDVIARILADAMRGSLGQPVVVENIAGASGTIGVGRVARASPDGYTLVLGNWATHVLNGPMFALQYDLVKDFEPVALVSSDPLMIVGKNALPAKDLKEFVAWLKANPDQATQGTTGAGGISTVGGLFFQRETGTRFRFVPYRVGLAAAMQDLVAGQIDMMIGDPITGMPHVRAGLLKIYGVASDTRLPSAPEVPTVDEAGLPSFHISLWHGLWVPKGTPKPIIAKLHEAVLDALADPATRAKLAHAGQEIFPRDQQTPEALASLQKADIEKWWPIIKASGFKVE
jgi:tripartite-type tricarboxylate transporter receptor subunit TctC